jgi:AGZA family xanthine/uracil permease-like MFS transporter
MVLDVFSTLPFVERGSSFWTEFSGGMTTFFAMCYIMVLNGVIIGGPYNTGIPTTGVFFSTALASGIFTTMMGLFVNVPVALAPGMGLNGCVTVCYHPAFCIF